VLVAKRDRAQDIKTLVAKLDRAGRSETGLTSPSTGRARLSLQMHHHRAEQWLVVTGAAKVARGENEMMLDEDEAT